ncbi:MAG: hypothetical protein ACO1Q7_02545 [Gemmatimonas sp.]
MNKHSRLPVAVAILLMLSGATLPAQQDGLVAYPDVYKVQFENAYVRLIRVKLPASANLAEHSHPPGLMLHVYFNDAAPVQFNHDGPPNDVTRPPVFARSYRVGRATPEVHSVINTGNTMSDYMRVELKTMGTNSQRSRIPAPALMNATHEAVEIENAQYKASRVTVAGGQSHSVSAGAHPALFLALTDGVQMQVDGKAVVTLSTGAEQFLDSNAKGVIKAVGGAPIQLLRVDLLTAPEK